MLKRSVLLFVTLIVFLASAGPVLASRAPVVLYVKLDYSGPEEGTQDKPYNTEGEADAVAQTKPDGGVIMVFNTTANRYEFDHFVNPVRPGQTGIPLAGPVLYGLLVVLSLALILIGLRFQRRSRQLQHE